MQDHQRPAAHERLEQALALPALSTYLNDVIARAAEIIEHRTPSELEAIARYLDATIKRQAYKLAKLEVAPLTSEQLASFGPATPQRLASLGRAARFAYADAELWLWSGAQDKPPPQRASVPADVTRAEYLATLAVWKASYLGEFTRELAENRADNVLFAVHQVERLTMEITQACTMALEARYFDQELAKARAAGAAEREKALLDARDLHVREAGARGGAARAAKFLPAKRRAIELYEHPPGKPYRSRLAAAEEIAKILAAEGHPARYNFVLDTLKEHDAAIRARATRARRGKGAAGQEV